MNDGDKSETKHIILNYLSEMRSDFEKRFDKIESKVETVPVIKNNIEQHERWHDKHFENIDKLKTDVNKAKGWGAALGVVGGFITGFFHK